LKRFLSLKISIPVAAVAIIGGALYMTQAVAYTAPSFDDSLTALVDKRGFRRLGATTTFACGGGCVAARTAGAARRGCVLYVGNVSGGFRAASDDCAVALLAACTGQAVDDCASGERF
ncbi:MAG TPA: hypothetical protein VFT91_05695, partial [Dehalococcoidia bacterium]|nr:hypothetical protein [Dehalococcoidia bacterium]